VEAAGQPGYGGRKWFSRPFIWLVLILGGALVVLFIQSFQPEQILFANDTTLGQMKAAASRLPAGFTGTWRPGSWIGIESLAVAPTISALLTLLTSPELFLKFYAPFSLFFLGFCAWIFFRQLGFNPGVCLLGGVAAGLNMHFFSVACWGLGSWNVAAGMIFLALAALSTKSISSLWARGILAGLAVGMDLMEGFDVGAILCVYVGIFIIWQIFSREGPLLRKISLALCTEALVIVFSALIAAHSISTLVGTQVVGVVGTGQDEETKQGRWRPATQWSLPKIETLRLFVPGLFGYRLQGRITVSDKSSAYWGTVGENPALSDFLDGTPDQRAKTLQSINLPPDICAGLDSNDLQTRLAAIKTVKTRFPVFARYSGSGEYAGVLVSLLAVFALANSFRGLRTPYSHEERRLVWFCGGAALFSLLAAWGRHAFFYRLLYQLPYVSTIRNPIKFLHPFHIAWLILATCGLEALWRLYLRPGTNRSGEPLFPLRKWWSKLAGFEKKWAAATLGLIGLALLALFIYNAWKFHLVYYLVQDGFDPALAAKMASFSIVELAWFAFWLLVSAGVIVALVGGAWKARHASTVWVCLGAIIILDLARSDMPWIYYFDYKTSYAADSVIDFLKDKPYEHRVTGRLSPKGLGSGINSPIGKLYDYWQQNDFPFYSIQALDFAQWPRVPLLDANYMKKFNLHGIDLNQGDLWPAKRLWELTNTRYLVHLASAAPLLNKQADAADSFVIKCLLKVAPKVGLSTIEDYGGMTAVPDDHGTYALIEFAHALPRAKLYSNWQSPTNDEAVLDTLASHEFDPQHTVLVSPKTPLDLAPENPKLDAGIVSITDYQPKDVKLQASALTPAVLLLNDRITPAWGVWVDQKPAPLLRCNYLMRGVFLTPGEHTVEFRFQPPLTTLCLSLCGWAAGIITAGFVVYTRRTEPPPQTPSIPIPSEKAPAASQTDAATGVKQKRRKQRLSK
jgi:hypothetical protein